MPLSNSELCLACCVVLAGCAGPKAVDPGRSGASSQAADNQAAYQQHVQRWTGHLKPKMYANAFARMPSDARLLPVDSDAQASTRFQEMRSQFRSWCAANAAKPVDRALDMQSPGDGFLVCESGTQRLAALRIYLDLEASGQGRRELLIQHWYPQQIAEYIADVGASTKRMAAEDQVRRQHDSARAQREAQARQDQRAREAEERARVAKLPSPAVCKAFERQSNALRTRLSVGVELSDARRQLAELAVAYDECESLRAGAPQELLALYRFNLQSFQLFVQSWEAGLTSLTALLDEDRRRFLALLARFPLVTSPAADGTTEIVDRTIRFVLDR